jgi:hypothetical protein
MTETTGALCLELVHCNPDCCWSCAWPAASGADARVLTCGCAGTENRRSVPSSYPPTTLHCESGPLLSSPAQALYGCDPRGDE